MNRFRSLVAVSLIVSITGLGLPLSANAAMLPTDTAVAATSGVKDRLASLLERREVRAQLEALGVNPADVKARVAALTDTEAAQLAGQVDQLPAGGDAAGALIGAAILVFIVLLITDILGFTHVFPFTKPIR